MDRAHKMNEQIVDEASEWFVTLRFDAVGRTVQERFMEWLRASPEHVRAYLDIIALWTDLPHVDREHAIDVEALIQATRQDINVISLPSMLPSEGAAASKCSYGAAKNECDITRMECVPTQILPRTAGEGSCATENQRAAVRAPLDASRGSHPRRVGEGWSGGIFISLAAVLLAWFYFFHVGTYSTTIGEQRSITLADGSTVQLNSLSKIRVRFSENERVIDLLEGQALFSVAKDAQRPFIVRSGDVRARAVGTQFDVYRKKSATVVTVVEGRVAVEREAQRAFAESEPQSTPTSASNESTHEHSYTFGEGPLVLSAGEQVTVAGAGEVNQPVAANVSAAVAWTERKLIFTSTPLSSVVEEFNRYSKAQLIIGENVDDIPITAVFSTTNPKMLIDFLDEQPEFEVTVGRNSIHIHGERRMADGGR